MDRPLSYLGLVLVFCSLAGCNERSLEMIAGLVGPNRGADAADEENKPKGRSTVERQVDEIVAENQRQLEEVQAYVNQQVLIGHDAVKSATPRARNSSRRSTPSRSGGINTNPYLDD